MSEDVLTVLNDKNIFLVRVPTNMTHIFHPLIWQWMKHSKPLFAKSFPSGTVDRVYTL